MAITQNLSRVRVESAAKNGTLGSQSGLLADQIKFDTAISTNNGNLVASPTFEKRHVILRRGETNEERGLVKAQDVDGLTCTMQAAWDEAPASGDTYDVAYRLEDVATVAGCDFETDSRQWVMSKRFTIGDGTNFAFFGMSHGQILRLQDSDSATTSAMRVTGSGRFHIGTIKNDIANLGAILIFNNDADDELVMDWLSGAKGYLYEFSLVSGRNPDGVNSLDVTVDAGATVEWARGQHYAIDSPFKNTVKRFKNQLTGIFVGDKSGVLDLPEMKGVGWGVPSEGGAISDIGKTIKDEIAAKAAGDRVRLLIEEN